MTGRDIYIEIGPIYIEKYFSGIPNVTMHIVDEFRKLGYSPKYFHGPRLLRPDLVEAAVRERTNRPLQAAGESAFVGKLPVGSIIPKSLGIFTNARHGLPRLFERECQIVYDLTPLVTPQFHHKDTIDFHKKQYISDLKISDYFVCISEATKRDLVDYLDFIDERRAHVALLAGEKPEQSLESMYISEFEKIDLEPYFLFIGTIEPRKNLGLLFQMFREFPEVLDQSKWVICGRNGWLLNFEEMMKRIDSLGEFRKKQVVRYEYVSNIEKYILLKKARALVFPSFYEGFGLPVIEAMQVGCPVIASYSSSIPEAGGDCAFYINPESPYDLYEAVVKVNSLRVDDRTDLISRCQRQAESFSWQTMADTILGHEEEAV